MLRTTRRVFTFVLLAWAPRAGALTGNETAPASISVPITPASHETVSALQLVTDQSASAGLSLSATPTFLGRYGLTVKEILAELAPNLTACTLQLMSSADKGDAEHEYYSVFFGDFPLEPAFLHLHHAKNKLIMLRSDLPDYHLPPEPFTQADFLPLSSLGFPAEGAQESTRAVIAESAGLPTPAWELVRFDRPSGQTRRLVIDAQSGNVISSVETAFDLAEVYAKGPADGHTVSVDLPDLAGTGYLDGKNFSVLAPTQSDPRARAQKEDFIFRPDDAGDAVNFDQVAAYYGATRASAWFQRKFGYALGNVVITVRTNDLVGGRADNAMYLPAPAGPEIDIGKGNDVLTNLARDTDVISHEFSHHIIYEHLKEHIGEAGILHEGTADFFAYAISGDGCLAKSVVVAGGCLRTANLAADDQYDHADQSRGIHFLGQYWSAVLWSLRSQLGDSVDQLVYDALAYFGPASGLRDAFLALLNADRDQNPLPTGASEAGIYGKNKCLILQVAVARGFAAFLGDFDGSSCGMNLAQLAADSRFLLGGGKMAPSANRGASFAVFGHKCSVVSWAKGAAPPALVKWLALLLLATPVPLAFVRRSIQRDQHGS